MAIPDRANLPVTAESEQSVLNKSQDSKYGVLAVEMLGEVKGSPDTLVRVSVSDTGAMVTSASALATRLDDTTTPGMIYIGKAAVGTISSAAVWQIARLDVSTGLIKTFADGDSNFNNVWDNRASLSYS